MIGAKHHFLILILVIGLAACSSRSVNTELTRCVFPDSTRTPAPSFICGDIVAGFPVTALRSSELSETAVVDRIQLVFEDQLNEWSKTWAGLWFEQPEQQQRAEVFLLSWLEEHARVVRSRVSPKAKLWLLVGQPLLLSELERITKESVIGIEN